MAMGYKLSARVLLEGLQRGDRVRFTLDSDKRIINAIKKIKN